MYVQIKVANQEDAVMTRDVALKFGARYAQVVEGAVWDCTAGWWFVRAWCTQKVIDELLVWSRMNEVKIFSIETGRGNLYYEANS